MTKTFAKKNTAPKYVELNDIPNLGNSAHEQAFKSNESINKSTLKKMFEEISHKENVNVNSEIRYDDLYNEVPSVSN